MENLKQLAIKLGTDGPVKVLPTPRMVKLLFNGIYFLQTTAAVFIWEHPYYSQYYVHMEDLLGSWSHIDGTLKLTKGEAFTSHAGKTVGHQLTLEVGSKSITNAVLFSTDLTGPAADLRGLVRIDFASVDQWFEEDTPIVVHPKDPSKRIDILHSSRHIRVLIDGKVIAETTTSSHLYETSLPCRYYMPLTSVDMTVLRPSKTKTKCPYKGEAEYYSVEVDGKVHEDVVWFYRAPILESVLIAGLICFYNEKVDIELDGVKLQRPETHFGKSKPSEDKKPSAT